MAVFDLGARARELVIGLGIGLVVVVAVWVGVYAGGFFPILGYAYRQLEPTGAVAVDKTYGLPYMLLLQGQTAWFEYDVAGVEWRVRLSVRQGERALTPKAGGGRVGGGSDRIQGGAFGRVEFRVPATGLYRFEIASSYTQTINEREAQPRYGIYWGADF